MSTPDSKRKPSGSRPVPRRLFSGSSSRSKPDTVVEGFEKSTGSSRQEYDYEKVRARARTPSQPLDLAYTDRALNEVDPFSDSPVRGNWSAKEITSSPGSGDEKRSFSPTFHSASPAGARPRPSKKASMLSTLSSITADTISTDDQPPSPSKRRWESLRQHVLPVGAAPPRMHQATASLVSVTPPRPSTPKQFRIPRLGFKQVVEQVQEVSIDHAKRFSDDVQRACLATRFGEQKGQKREREGTMGIMAAMNFMNTTTSIPGTASSSTTNLANLRTKGTRRPPSIQSVATAARGISASSSLYAVVIRYASIGPDPAGSLPHESEVLSVLLIPFLSQLPDALVETERIQAIETLEIIVKIWTPASNEAELERCIWCCKAAQSVLEHKHIRMRALGILSSCLFAPGGSFRAGSPVILQSLLQALFALFTSLSSAPITQEEAKFVKELIASILQGSFTDLDHTLVEQEYDIQFYADDNPSVVGCLVVIALSACLDNSSEACRSLVLRCIADDYWSADGESALPLANLTPLYARKLVRCAHSLFNYLPAVGEAPLVAKDVDIVFRVLQMRLIPEAQALADHEAAHECRVAIARLAVKILCLGSVMEQQGVTLLIAEWSEDHAVWKASFEAALMRMMKEDSLPSVILALTVLLEELPDDVRTSVSAAFLPALNDRLVQDPPSYPSPALTELLETLSHTYPKLFFKPLFACAAASKDASVVAQLRIVTVLSTFFSGFWTRDVDMILVALMSGSNSAPAQSEQEGKKPWAQARLGQLVILAELIAHVQKVMKERDFQSATDHGFTAKARFFFTLEYKLGSLLEAKERTTLLPVCQRIMLSSLFLEIRVLLRSLKQAQWLPRVVGWVADSQDEVGIDEGEDPSPVFAKITALYSAARDPPRVPPKRRSAFLLSPSVSEDGARGVAPNGDKKAGFFAALSDRHTLLDMFAKGLMRNTFRLFVAVSGLLTNEDYEHLGTALWRGGLDSLDPEVQASATFLIMQSAEKVPNSLLALIRGDMKSPEAYTRRQAAKRISLLSGWRFQLLSQTFITDKNHRRPFRLARGPIAFMATDIGSGTFVLEEDPEQLKASNGTVLPLELRKRLADIGWTQDDVTIDQQQEWARTPLSLLSPQQVERLDNGSSPVAPRSPLLSPVDSSGGPPSPLLEAANSVSSTSSHQGVKRRPIFVPSLASMLSEVAFLAYDLDYTVASAARSAILDLMRDDPALITRPILDSLSGDEESINSAISVLRAFLHIQRTLPPAMAHHIFNHLTGFLKFSARQPDMPNTLQGFAYSLPVLSKLVTQVSEMSIREIRRAKVEIFLIPSGTLWFPPSAPSGAMFPRVPGLIGMKADPDALSRLAHVTLIRVSQNVLFLDMLKRNPQDVQAIRKNMSRLVLPSMNDAVDPPPVELRAYAPRRKADYQTPTVAAATVAGLSLLLSRSYILLVAEIFRSMPRHLNDRNELAVLIDGLNRILLVHGDDIGVVGHTLIALMTASTRFRRIFMSGGGYTLFMSSVTKIYAESEHNQGIRAAIEYAANRFYALHQEAFVFQSLDVLSQIAMFPEVDGVWMAEQIYSLLSTLRNNAPLFAPDVAGIHDSNKTQEREALLVTTAEDKPQAFISLLRRNNGPTTDRIDITVPDEYEDRRLALDNLVRLFLTVIGHDPGIRRAEQFLRLLQFMAPSLYDSTPAARNVLREGINALSLIFLTRSAGKAKVPEASQIRSNDFGFDVFTQEASLAGGPSEVSKGPSDLAEMRLDYLSLVAAFTRAGGYFSSVAAQRIVELVKVILKDSNRGDSDRVASFISDYARNALIRSTPLRLKHVLTWLTDMAPVFKAYAAVIDLSGVLSVISQLAGDPHYANEPSFSRMVVQYCVVALEVCDLAASEGLSSSLPLRPVLIKLLCQALFLKGVEIMDVLEKEHISYEFLAGIIYPMALTLPSTEDILRDMRWPEEWRRTAPARTWTRFLALILHTCRKPESTRESERPNVLERTRSQESRKKPAGATPATSLSISLQILKIIILRAEDDLSTSIPGVWIQIGLFFKSFLADGNAKFALESQSFSVPPSPLGSPKGLRPRSLEDVNPFAPRSRPVSPSRPSFSQPRILDYLLWSVLEFTCLHRSPLMIQLRILMQEKTTILDQWLRQQQQPLGRGSRLSFASVFSKPRRRSGYWSGGPSPEASPLLTPAKSVPQDLFLTPPRPDERQPGYARFASPMTPSGNTFVGPKIVHLGPVHNPDMLFRRSPSPGGGGGGAAPQRMWRLAKSTKVKSVTLVRATYRRVRVVQQMMGYGTLLPALDLSDDLGEEVKLWSRAEALRAVVHETDLLMEEFREAAEEEDDDTVMVDPDQSLAA